MDIQGCNVSIHLPEDFKSGLDGDSHLGRKKRILTAAPGQYQGRISNHLRIGRGGNVRIARDIGRVQRTP